ncbi:MAG: hypothetical protein KJZ53_08730 [Anaerolineales bacterium]|nr:hypothetical protein [Anaerolineales bacterium]
MAKSYAHQFGQVLGNLVESAVEGALAELANKHQLYFDKKGKRKIRKGVKVRWNDRYGNFHDLDYVLERNGELDRVGIPAAFIEVAWRRYTRHSKNKVQEIQGAIQPLKETYAEYAPFAGAILAGEFTKNSLQQLRSLGFHVLHISYDEILSALDTAGVEARFDEATTEEQFRAATLQVRGLPERKRNELLENILKPSSKEYIEFMTALETTVSRRVERIRIYSLHSDEASFSNAADAINYISNYTEEQVAKPFQKYELIVRYTNGDSISGVFSAKNDAVVFLRSMT